MREEARDFRLISTALSPESRVRTRAEEQEKLSQGSIQTIHQQLYLQPRPAAHRAGAADLRAAVAGRIGRAPQGQGARAPTRRTSSRGAISRGRRRAGRDPEGAAAVRARIAAAVAAALLRRARDGGGHSSACPSSRGARRAASWWAIAPPCASSSRAEIDAAGERRGSRSCASCSRSACSRPSSARSTSTSASTARRPS